MLPRTQEGQQGGGAGTPKRKPAVRRDPEKRRYQNLQAQKKYRMLTIGPGEKLRQRLKRLEALAETAAHGRPTSQVPAAGQGLSAAVNTSSTAQGDNFATAVPHSAPGALASSLSTTATHYSQLAPQLGNFPLDLDFWNPNEYAPLLDDPSLLGTRDPTVLPLSDETIWYPPQVEPTRGSNTSEDTIHGAINYASLPAVSSTFISTASNNSVTNTDRGEPLRKQLRVDQHCTLTALFLVIEHIGIPMDLICAEEFSSPFFRRRRLVGRSIDRSQHRCRLPEILQSKAQARPAAIQRANHHQPPSINRCLSLPTPRNNLVTCQAEYDEDDFFHDSLVGLRDRNASAGKASTGTPWDLRSWEAQELFLRKYWSLMGGEDGELVRQTERWRTIRGEDALDVVEL
ncbi:hypothetical protein BDW66DRAFT_169260 [Aspergillus desertorum]